MKKIEFLKDGGTISLVAPSFACETEPYRTRLLTAINKFKSIGYKIDEGENIYVNKGYIASNTPKARAKEFMKAYLSSSDVIISVGGGELMIEILPYINFDKINKAKPKLFMGFSDNTNLTYLLTTICEIPTIYGANFPSFAFENLRYGDLDSFKLLRGETNKLEGYPYWEGKKKKIEDPLKESELKTKKVIRTYPKKDEFEFEGIMLGGNLDILSLLCGTKYDKTKEFIEKYKNKGIIWFLEACDLNVLSIRRALFSLREAGWFKYVKGFLIGRPLSINEKFGNANHINAVTGVLKELNVPILMDIDLGHFEPTMPFVTGAYAKVKYADKNIEIEYDFNDEDENEKL